MKIIFKKTPILLLLFLFYTQSLYSQWNSNSQTYKAVKYNIEWDLSEFGEWRIATQNQLPKDMIFCGALKDDAVSASLICISSDDPIDNVWDNAEDFIESLNKTLKEQYNKFPGIEKVELQYEKTYLLFKKALRFGAIIYINDIRLSTNEAIPFLYGGYVFVKGNTIIEPIILIPWAYVEKYGDEIVDQFFKKISYIDINKE